MSSSVWRDVRSRNGGRSRSGDVIVGLCDGNRIWRVSPDNNGGYSRFLDCVRATARMDLTKI